MATAGNCFNKERIFAGNFRSIAGKNKYYSPENRKSDFGFSRMLKIPVSFL